MRINDGNRSQGNSKKIYVMSESELAVIAEEMDVGKDIDEHLLKMSTEWKRQC